MTGPRSASTLWDGVADRWERYAASVDAQAAAATETMLDAARVTSGSVVLDIGCGPGGAGLAAARRTGPSGRVVLADSAPTMLQVAAHRAAQVPGVDTIACDMGAINAADGSFDAVLCRYALMFAEQPAAAIAEAIRVLRPGGHYAALTFAGPQHNPWQSCALDAVADVLGAPVPPPGAPGPFSLSEPDVLHDVLRRGGLTDVHVEKITSTVTYPSPQRWWDEASELAGPLPLILAGLAPAVRETIRERALHHAQQAATDDGAGLRFPCLDLLAHGRRP